MGVRERADEAKELKWKHNNVCARVKHNMCYAPHTGMRPMCVLSLQQHVAENNPQHSDRSTVREKSDPVGSNKTLTCVCDCECESESERVRE